MMDELIQWFCLFETPELGKHLIRAVGPKDEKLVRPRIKAMHANMTILDLHPVKDMKEFEDAAAKLAENPDWTPITSDQLHASATDAIRQQIESGPEQPIAVAP